MSSFDTKSRFRISNAGMTGNDPARNCRWNLIVRDRCKFPCAREIQTITAGGGETLNNNSRAKFGHPAAPGVRF